MKRVLHTTLALLLIAVLFVGMAPTAQAAGEEYILNIPLKVEVTGSNPVPGAYALIALTPKNAENPIPGELNNGSYIHYMPLTNPVGKSEDGKTLYYQDVIHMEIPQMGVYSYTISFVGGTYYHQDVHYELHNLDVCNFNNDTQTGGEPDYFQIYTELGEGNKKSELLSKISLTEVNVAKKWIDQESIRPTSVTVELLLDGERPTLYVEDGLYGFEDLVLNESCSWQRKWTGLDGYYTGYSVKEVKVPAGYVATYKYADGVYTITNTGALIQTGQLNWPIPVLCGAGCLFILAGMLMLRRKEEENA